MRSIENKNRSISSICDDFYFRSDEKIGQNSNYSRWPNVFIGNEDDHLRNHGFIRDDDGWRLSPLYDVFPIPARRTSTPFSLAFNIGDAGTTATLDLDNLYSRHRSFNLNRHQATQIIAEVADATATWEHALRTFRWTRPTESQCAGLLEGSGRYRGMAARFTVFAPSFDLNIDDVGYAPFAQESRVGKVHQLFGGS